MQFNLYYWLFDDARSAASHGSLSDPETFHFAWAWLIISCVGLLISFYYSVEGRKRFFKDLPIERYMLDRFLGWLAIICFIALPLLFGRVYLDGFFFAWRFWRYLWGLSLLSWAVIWGVYMLKKYPVEKKNFVAYIRNQQYVPKAKNKKKRAAYAR